MLNVYTNPVFYEHDTGAGHPESARRIDAAIAGVERAGLVERVNGDTRDHPDTDRMIAKVHSADYERALEQAAQAGLRDFVSGDNPMSSQTFAAARSAVVRASASTRPGDTGWTCGSSGSSATPWASAWCKWWPSSRRASGLGRFGFSGGEGSEAEGRS